MKLKIKVKAWGRGNYCRKGKCCALGFLYRQAFEEDIKNGKKSDLENDLLIGYDICHDIKRKFPKLKLDEIINVNDNLDREKRREELTKLFKDGGIEVEFE